eukprot:TRINITY_DN2876_c1_g1_i1.p1 TRINITY_DN2876_c1_g1~~TRINITY_DN2876_c1_g1_i1.p1  ORF type:complete len:147 (-),score=43.26 TRINITY_DN2876_c1_g1_i1:9-449(-)
MDDFSIDKNFSEDISNLFLENKNLNSFGLLFCENEEFEFHFDPICEALKKKKNLEYFSLCNLNHNENFYFHFKNGKCIQEILEANKSIKKLDLYLFGLDANILSSLLIFLANCHELKSLTLFNPLCSLKNNEMNLFLSSTNSLSTL